MTGESKPNWMLALEPPPTAPPFAMWPEGLLALMVTEDFLAWSEAPFRLEPWTTAGFGTAGAMLGRPFTGEAEGAFPFCAAAAPEEPTTTGGLVVPAAISGA